LPDDNLVTIPAYCVKDVRPIPNASDFIYDHSDHQYTACIISMIRPILTQYNIYYLTVQTAGSTSYILIPLNTIINNHSKRQYYYHHFTIHM